MIPVPDRSIFAVCSGPLGSVRAADRPTYWKEHGYPQDFDPQEFVRAGWVIEWIKDRHLAWCRGEADAMAVGFDDWIDQQWAAATSGASRDTEQAS
jgi:hypothetical protein